MSEPTQHPTPETPGFLPPRQYPEPGQGAQLDGPARSQEADSPQPPEDGSYSPPGPRYAQAEAPYPAGGTPYPQPGAPYPNPGPSYPQPGSPYPGADATYPQPGTPYPQPGTPYPQPGAPVPSAADQPPAAQVWGADANPGAAVPTGPENVGRGILFSLLGIVIGAVLAAVIYQWGFIASITSFAMAWAAGWLYAKGAGAPPRKGVVPLIVVIVFGVVLSLFAMLGWSLYSEFSAEFPGAAASDVLPVVLEYLFYPEVWQVFATDALIFVLFAALGTFSVLRQLGRTAAAQA